jgi:hypothetical protein
MEINEVTYKIREAIFEVYNQLGLGYWKVFMKLL